MLKLSSNFKKFKSDTKEVWINDLTGQRINAGPVFLSKLNQILFQQLDTQEIDEESFFRQVLALELVNRGFAVPRSINESEERRFQQDRNPTRLPKEGFFHVPTAWHFALPNSAEFAFLGVPSDFGAAHPGTRNGPRDLRAKSQGYAFRSQTAAGILNLSSRKRPLKDRNIYDIGDIAINRGNLDEWLVAVEKVISSIPRGAIPITIGGDHSFSLSTIVGTRKKLGEPFTIIHIDNHLDLQVWGQNLEPPTHANFMSHVLSRAPDLKLVQLGIRNYQSVPTVEGEAHASAAVAARLTDLDLLLDDQLDRTLEKLNIKGPIYISFDVDALSHSLMPQTGYPASMGLSLSKVFGIFKFLSSNFEVVGADFMEYGEIEKKANSQQSAELLITLILFMMENIQERKASVSCTL